MIFFARLKNYENFLKKKRVTKFDFYVQFFFFCFFLELVTFKIFIFIHLVLKKLIFMVEFFYNILIMLAKKIINVD
jgi:hypothetical protein